MKILIAYDNFLKLVVKGQARELALLGHDVRLLSRVQAREFGNDFAERDRILDMLRGRGVELWELPPRRLELKSLPAVRRIRRMLTDWRPDVVSAHEMDEVRLLAAVRGWPLVYTVHDPEPHPGANRHPALRAASALWMQAADHLVVHGSQLTSVVPRRARHKPLSVVPHGIDTVAEPLPAPAAETVLMFGRLEPYKGIDVLVRAMQEVWKRRPAVRLVVAGRGPCAWQVPDDPRIELRQGYVPEEDVPALLETASVMVLPYTQASQSGVGLLSIAHGVPIVVTAEGALPELLEDPAEAVPSRDPHALASQIVRVLERGDDARVATLGFAKRKFEWSVVAKAYADLYADVIEAGNAARAG